MNIKLKKLHSGRVVRMQGSGEIKEISIEGDMLDVKKEKIMVCFRGRESSGIIELTEEEADNLVKSLKSNINLVKSAGIIKSKK